MSERPIDRPAPDARGEVRVVAVGELEEAQVHAVEDLLATTSAQDGAVPLDEAARLALHGTGEGPARHVLALGDGAITDETDLLGYASVLADGTVQGMVAPDARRRGIAGALLAAARGQLAELDPQARLALWSHGDLPEAATFCAASGLEPVRTLLSMSRELGPDAPALPAPRELPEGYTASRMDPEGDAEALLAVNARAFADHPEQGSLDLPGLRARMAEAWFDAEDVHLARVAEGDSASGVAPIAAFVWLKREHSGADGAEGADAAVDEAEVYVVGTDPEHQGRGLATTLLVSALRELAAAGVSRADLYVESDAGAVGLYDRLGFTITGRDVQYASAVPAGPRAAIPDAKESA